MKRPPNNEAVEGTLLNHVPTERLPARGATRETVTHSISLFADFSEEARQKSAAYIRREGVQLSAS
jgi:hypothetical protein